MDKHQILKQYFGHKAFREGQEQLIDSLLSGRDALGIMPTGGGKSMCYQVPALMLPGVTLVVSPLISLMKDQVMALKHAGIPAAYINSSLTPAQLSTVYQRLRAGAYKLVYVALERLEADGFVSAAQSLDISLLAVDEAHCISQWGQDFRPSYRKIPDFLTKLPRRPVIGAFTATATAAVRRPLSGWTLPSTALLQRPTGVTVRIGLCWAVLWGLEPMMCASGTPMRSHRSGGCISPLRPTKWRRISTPTPWTFAWRMQTAL